jgi:hypothetical protein
MAQPDRTALLTQAIEIFNAGRRAEARTLLSDLSQRYPDMELAWLWLAAATDDYDEKVRALGRVLAINPANQKARVALARLDGEPEPAELSPQASASTQAPTSSPSSRTPDALTIGLFIAVIVAVVVIIGLLLNRQTLQGILRPSATPTVTASPAPTATLRYTYVPTITPGGPTFTPFVTLPPPATWTIAPSATPLPTFTRFPTDTAIPTDSATLRPTITPFISPTPSDVPTLVPIPTLPAATGQSSTMVATAILPTASPTRAVTATSVPVSATPTPTTAAN